MTESLPAGAPRPTLSIILCVYNERERLPRAFDELLESLHQREEHIEILIVDNGSSDGTREWLAGLSVPRVRILLNEQNVGKGGSIRRALAESRGDYVVIHDPDCEYLAADIWPLLDRMRGESADLGLGSRLAEGRVRFVYIQNYFGVWGLTTLINLLYGCRITDAATAMKMLRGDLARRLALVSTGFDLDFELVVRIARLGGRIVETGVQYFPRSRREGKKIRALRDGLSALRVILRDRLVLPERFLLNCPSGGEETP